MQYQSYGNGSNYIWLGLLLLLLFGGARIFFVIFGLFLAFLPAILIGTLIFFVLRTIRHNAVLGDYLRGRSSDHQRFTELFIHLIAHVIHADNKVDDREIQAVIQFFAQRLRFNQTQLVWVSDLLNKSLDNRVPLEQVCSQINDHFIYESKLMLVELLYLVCLSDHHMDAREQAIIDQLVRRLSISDWDHQTIRSAFQAQTTPSNQDHHRKILGVSAKATPTEIKKAYRDACKKYHPDKVQHLGDEFKKVAEEKFKSIQTAYEALMKTGAAV